MLSGGYINDKYDPELIQKVLDLLVPESTRYVRVTLKGKTDVLCISSRNLHSLQWLL